MTYRTRSGDTWDAIAKEIYGSEYRADALMEANRGLLDVFLFSAGTMLTVPALEQRRDDSLPPWKFEADYAG